MMRLCGWLAGHVLLAAMAVAQAPSSLDGEALGLLSDRCFRCHGPDGRARRSELRLDVRDDAVRVRTRDDGSSYRVVAPGAPDQSELLRRIHAAGDERMPPADSKLSLSAAERAVLRRWIAAGARWPVHWAFVAPRAVAPPVGAAHPVDAFVVDALRRREVAPRALSEPADKAALLRRVTLDLTGLPPSEAELDAFVADPSERAYEAVVDRLLASPHYGERMAWPWLEAARYADTDGYQSDPLRTAWPWRDWLVRALNDNVPFDRFLMLCLAGDLVPGGTDEDRLGSAFLRHNAHNGEGGRIAEETRVENGFDRTETVGTVFLGMTFECARCHDHKYDPLPQRDYYRMFAFFDQTSETGALRSGGKLPPTMRYLPDPKQRQELARLRDEADALAARLSAREPALEQAFVGWCDRVAGQPGDGAVLPIAPGPWRRSKAYRGERLFETAFAPEAAPAAVAEPTGLFEGEPKLVDGEPLALPQGEYAIYFRRVIDAPAARRLALSFGSDDGIVVWWNGERVLNNDVRRGVRKDQERVEVDALRGSNVLLVKIVNTGGAGGVFFRVAGEGRPGLSLSVSRALAKRAAERSRVERESLWRAFRSETDADYRAELARLEPLRERIAALERQALDVSVMDTLPIDKRRTTTVYARGNYQTKGEAVTAGTPGFLPKLSVAGDAAPTRLDLARWLVSGEHPLTARVAVNRAWQTLFGRGLVATGEDFGRQGDAPSHPELLDWLSVWFVEHGWDVKGLHRLLVTSRTYRQSASAVPAAFAEDPDNVWLARSARRRWPAWLLRDQALALSGALLETLGGQPVRPYQPDGVWAEATFGFIRYQQGEGDELRRRSLYTFWRRIVGPTVLFDTPGRQQCVVRHDETNTPLHALVTLNADDYVVAARGFADRALARGDGDGDDARLDWLFRSATGRRPSDAERRVLRARLERDRKRYRADHAAATALLAVGGAPVEAPAQRALADVAERAVWTQLALLVLNLDEVLTRP